MAKGQGLGKAGGGGVESGLEAWDEGAYSRKHVKWTGLTSRKGKAIGGVLEIF